MSNTQRLRDLIDLEVFLFHGVPEKPNPVYGRDSYSNVHSRRTRDHFKFTSQSSSGSEESSNLQSKILEQIIIDTETGEVTFTNISNQESKD